MVGPGLPTVMAKSPLLFVVGRMVAAPQPKISASGNLWMCDLTWQNQKWSRLRTLQWGDILDCPDRPNIVTESLKSREPFWAVVRMRCDYKRMTREIGPLLTLKMGKDHKPRHMGHLYEQVKARQWVLPWWGTRPDATWILAQRDTWWTSVSQHCQLEC